MASMVALYHIIWSGYICTVFGGCCGVLWCVVVCCGVGSLFVSARSLNKDLYAPVIC